MTKLKPVSVTVFFPSEMDISEDRARWYIEGAIRGWWQGFATESDPIREMRRCSVSVQPLNKSPVPKSEATSMTSKIEDGGSAYPLPVHLSLEGDEHIAYPGMSLRDHFAGQALPWALNHDYGNDWGKSGKGHIPRAAAKAYDIADAMIAARKGGAA